MSIGERLRKARKHTKYAFSVFGGVSVSMGERLGNLESIENTHARFLEASPSACASALET